jgi:hypothetical protein
MIEWIRDEEYEPLTALWQTIDTVIAGLRDLQAVINVSERNDIEPDPKFIGFGEPEGRSHDSVNQNDQGKAAAMEDGMPSDEVLRHARAALRFYLPRALCGGEPE